MRLQHNGFGAVVDRRHVLAADALHQSHAARHNVVDLPVYRLEFRLGVGV